MKKIISVMLCAMMLFGVISVSAFAAEVPDNAKALEEFGQKSFYVGDEIEVAPNTLDGVVTEGEYTLEILGMKPDDDAIDDRIFILDQYDIEYVNLYVAQDFDNIYVAAEVKDPSFIHRDGVAFHLGLKENIDSALVFSTHYNDIPDDTNMTIDFYEFSKPAEDPTNIYAFGDVIEYPSADAYNYVIAKGLSYNEETQIATYELAFSRLMLEEFAGGLFDSLFLRVVVAMKDDTGTDIGTVWFGFRGDSETLRTKHHCYLSRFPHVFYLYDGDGDESYVPEEEEKDNSGLPVIDLKEKVATAPTLDGVINDGEYTCTYDAEVTMDSDGWAFIDDNHMVRAADAPYVKGIRGASWSLAADEEYLYVASTIKTNGAAPLAQFYITKRQDTVSYPMTATVSADGSVNHGNAAWNFVETKSSNDGTTYVFEGKIAIDDITDNPEKLYLMARAYLDEGFLLFGLNEDALGGVCGFKVELAEEQTPPETEPTETEPTETEPTETEPTETEPTETEPTETEPTETEPTETEPTETEPAAEGGCGSSIAAIAVALVAALGTCAVFVNKRR